MGGDVRGELLPYSRQPLGPGGERKRETLVFAARGCDELGQSNRLQQARADPAGEGLSGTGEDRQACPQRVDRSGVRVVVEGVEHEVGDTVAREVRRGLELGSEYQAGGRD